MAACFLDAASATLGELLFIHELLSMRRVSHLWHDQVQRLDGAAWQNLSLASNSKCNERLAAFAASPVAAHIRHIGLEFCSKFQNSSAKLLAGFSSLSSLSLDYCCQLTDEGVGDAVRACPNLRALSLYWNPSLTKTSIDHLCAAPAIAKMTKINLSGVRHLTDDAIEQLVACCPSLTHLDLTRLEQLRDPSLQAVAAHCPNLVSLKLYACANFTNAGVIAIASGCPRLEFLDITGSHSVYDEGVVAVAQQCTRLQALMLTWCIKLTDKSLEALGRADHSRLNLLSVHGNCQMTPAGLAALGKGCPHLLALDINGCKCISDRTLGAAQQLCPSLRVLVPL